MDRSVGVAHGPFLKTCGYPHVLRVGFDPLIFSFWGSTIGPITELGGESFLTEPKKTSRNPRRRSAPPCPACGGRGYVVVPGRAGLPPQRLCAVCGSSGRV